MTTLTVFMFLTFGAYGKVLKFVDQNGAALENVVVSNPAIMAPMPISQTPAVMDQVTLQFFPHVLVIAPGQAVSFPNRDDVRHHVYSFSKPQPFEIKLYKNTPTKPIVFTTPGVIELGCNIHDQMLGYIYVASQFALVSNDNGIIELPTAWYDSYQKAGENTKFVELKVWHPRLSANRIEHQFVTIDLSRTEQLVVLNVVEALQINEPSKRKTRFGKKF